MIASRLRVLVVVIAAVAFVAGCGDDDDDDGGDELSEAAYLEQGNALCTDANAEVDAAAEAVFASDEEPSPEAVEAFVDDEIVPTFNEMIDDLRELNGPTDLEDDVSDLLDDAQAVIDNYGEMSGDELNALFASGEDPFAEVDARSVELGLTACGEE